MWSSRGNSNCLVKHWALVWPFLWLLWQFASIAGHLSPAASSAQLHLGHHGPFKLDLWRYRVCTLGGLLLHPCIKVNCLCLSRLNSWLQVLLRFVLLEPCRWQTGLIWRATLLAPGYQATKETILLLESPVIYRRPCREELRKLVSLYSSWLNLLCAWSGCFMWLSACQWNLSAWIVSTTSAKRDWCKAIHEHQFL